MLQVFVQLLTIIFALTGPFREKMNIPSNVLEELITGAQSDIRQVLNMLSTWKLSRGDMNFDESKSL